jgi:hypothetical protein
MSDDLKGKHGEPWGEYRDAETLWGFADAGGNRWRLFLDGAARETWEKVGEVVRVRESEVPRLIACTNALDGVPTETLTAESKPTAVLLALAVLRGDTTAASALADLVTEEMVGDRKQVGLKVGDRVKVLLTPVCRAHAGRVGRVTETHSEGHGFWYLVSLADDESSYSFRDTELVFVGSAEGGG